MVHGVHDERQAMPMEWVGHTGGRTKTSKRHSQGGVQQRTTVPYAVQPPRTQKGGAGAQSMASIAFLSGEGVGSLPAPLLMRLDLPSWDKSSTRTTIGGFVISQGLEAVKNAPMKQANKQFWYNSKRRYEQY